MPPHFLMMSSVRLTCRWQVCGVSVWIKFIYSGIEAVCSCPPWFNKIPSQNRTARDFSVTLSKRSGCKDLITFKSSVLQFLGWITRLENSGVMICVALLEQPKICIV